MYPIAKYFVKQRQVINEKIQLERLNRKNILSHLGFLQQQMDNRFMLNSLNVLSSGIEEEWGRNYIKRLCNVYRYLVDGAKGDNIITVRKEVEFIESYNHLLKVRFEDGIKLNINLNDLLLSRKIPPMSLQTLVENAVKHNVVSPDSPLYIEIFNEKNNIIVRNNVQLRFSRTKQPGVGLQNLRERYRILTKTPVVVRSDANHYDVTISTI
ncbi:histidine kinase [Dyadobacter sp. LHD-138]|uniref:sensor histidine kinase n=1 Tax=Dyadobacter sp. LHD-138 TaxID=3071413 RepID=UPI0027E14FD5|nr:histidine kinase [Dyadobacter sp. LHD-138]MDQ6482048.1 histidine kinase [Dyadobacter sp. LHD-138]